MSRMIASRDEGISACCLHVILRERFEATCSFYETSLGCTPAYAWDRAGSRGVYYDLDGSPVAEILDASRGEVPHHPYVRRRLARVGAADSRRKGDVHLCTNHLERALAAPAECGSPEGG
jgi:hypothetical protein